MNKKLKKQKRRLFAIIATALSVLSIVMCFTFASVIFIDQQEWTYGYVSSRFDIYLRRILTMFADEPNGREYWTNLTHDTNNNIQIIVTDNETGEIYAQTRHCQMAYACYEDEVKIGYIEYDPFRASMTDEQYNKISEYLSSADKKERKGYILYYTEYYCKDREVFPTRLQLFEWEWNEEGTIIEETFVEEFKLNPSCGEDAVLGVNREPDTQSISSKFFLGEYKKADLLSEIKGKRPIYPRELDGPPMYYTSPFELVVCETRDDIEIETEDGKRTYTGVYAEKVNILDECIDNIAIMCLFTIIVFAITGVLIGAIAWKSVKKQIEQEYRLRTVTNAMAHQLKTPLFIIGGYSENLAENVNTEKRVHYAQVIKEQTVSMNEMVCKMLDYSKLDSDSFTLNIEKFELSALVKEIADCFSLDEAQVDCEADFYIEADKKLIRMAIENLIDNAVKYSADSSKISVSLKNNEFTVQNPYRAVTKQELKDMWKPYYRTTEKEKADGHGLGLAVVKNIFDLHKFKYSAKYADGNIIFSFSVSAE